MTGRWSVHLAPDASRTLRDATRSGAAVIGAALDRLQSNGPSGLDIASSGGAWSARVPAGDHVLTVAGRDGDRRVVVVQIDVVERHRATKVDPIRALRA